MPTQLPQKTKELQIGIENLAFLLRRGRELNGLSQQNLHSICKILGIYLYNSQFSHIEQAKLVLQPGTIVELEKLNNCFGNKKLIPPTQKDFSQEVRDKFINATPYLNTKNEPCDATDFFKIFVGIDDIHPSYRNVGLEITDEHAKNTTEYVRNIFLGYCQEEMLSRKEGWENIEPEVAKIMKQKKQQHHFKNILAGLEEWTQTELAAYTKNGTITTCPINNMWQEVTHKSMPECRDVWTKGHKVKYSKLKSIG